MKIEICFFCLALNVHYRTISFWFFYTFNIFHKMTQRIKTQRKKLIVFFKLSKFVSYIDILKKNIFKILTISEVFRKR